MPRLERTRKAARKPMDYRAATINLAPEDDELLDREADRMGVTRSAVMRLALRSWAMDGLDSAPSRSASGTTSRGSE